MNLETICINCMEDDSGAPVCPNCGASAQIPHTNNLQLAPRTVLRQQYLIGRALGHGGFGITYLAYDIGLQSRLAIKEYMPSGVAGRSAPKPTVAPFTERMKEEYEWGLDRFLDEARTLKKFSTHPNIVSVDTIFRDNGTAYMVMEYLEGMTFEEFLRRRGGKITFETGLRIMQPVMDALATVHAEGILHRDISPDNIHLSKTGKVKLMDFGAARNALSQKSRNLSVILKEGYAPEEQYRSSGIQGPWTDVYATAATLYHAITGKIPPPALDRTAEDRLETPSQFGIPMPAGSEPALMKALAVRAADRFQSMEDFKSALTGEARPLSQSPQTATMAPPPPQPQLAKTMPVPAGLAATESVMPQPPRSANPAPPAPPTYAPPQPQQYAVPPQPQWAPPAPPQMPQQDQYAPTRAVPPQQFPQQPPQYQQYPQYPPQQNYAAPPPPTAQMPQHQMMPPQMPSQAPGAKSGLPKWLIPAVVLALVVLASATAVTMKYGPDIVAKFSKPKPPADPTTLGQAPQPAVDQSNGAAAGAPPQSDDERQRQLEEHQQQQGGDQQGQDQNQQQAQDQQQQGQGQQQQQPDAAPAAAPVAPVGRRSGAAVVPVAPAPPPPAPVAAAPVEAAPVAPAPAPVAAAPVVTAPAGYDRMVAQAEDMINNSQYDEAAEVLKKAIALNPNKWQAYNSLAKDQLYFLHDPQSAFQNYQLALGHGGQASFYVYHDHGTGEFANTSSGWLSVSHGKMSFKSDDGADSFPTSPVKEAKKNKFFGKFLSASGKPAHAFHIRLLNDKLFNFAPSSGVPGPESDFIVKAID